MKINLGSAVVWSWIAGFFEGEGTCGTYWRKDIRYKNKGTYRLITSITQKNKVILNKIKNYVGYGNISPDRSNEGQWRLTISQGASRLFLNKILNYCNHPLKIKQINKALRIDKKYVRATKIKL